MTKPIFQKISTAILAAAVMSAVPLSARGAPESRSDSFYARELSRLGQVPLLNFEKQRTQGTAAEKLYDAQVIYATWTDLSKSFAKDRNAQASATEQYLTDINGYLNSPNVNVDGFWALDQAKFILGPLVEPIVNRMENWSNSARDRKALLPLAQMADRLLTAAKDGLKARQDAEERNPVFNEAAWKEAYASFNETDYYRGYDGYFKALATEPGDPGRDKILKDTAALLTWADEDPNAPAEEASGIKYQCLLLRGKIYSEDQQYKLAEADFAAAGEAPPHKAPGWVRYQAHYQAVVNKMRLGDGTAESALTAFKSWIATDPETSKAATAKVSAEMLHYRVAAAEADADKDPNERKVKQFKAMDILGEIVQQDPRYRDLVFEQLAALAPENAAYSSLPSLQALAVAWTKMQSVTDDKDLQGRKVLSSAVDAAKAVYSNETAPLNDRKEAYLIAALADARLGRIKEAVRADLDFVKISAEIEKSGGAKDPRAKDMVHIALSQIGDLRAAESGTPSKAVQELAAEATLYASGQFAEHQWDYARAMILVQQGKLQEAAALLQGMPPSDKHYFASRYQLLRVDLDLLNQATNGDTKQNTARSLVQSCEDFLRPPPDASKEDLQQIEQNRKDVLLIESSTALDPLKDAPRALEALDKLEKLPDLSPDVRGRILRDRIKAFQLNGDTTGATEAMKTYLQQFPNDAPNIIKGMIAADLGEIERVEKTDPARAREIAGSAVGLIKSLIDSTKSQSGVDPKVIYSYRQILADMETRAGMIKESIELFKALQEENHTDLFNKLGVARAAFADKQWSAAHDKFADILPQLQGGSDSYWEVYLRIIQCNEGLGTSDAKTEIVKTLKDLKASNADLGGTNYKADYEELLKKYEIK